MRIALAKDLVHRAQVLIESSLRLESHFLIERLSSRHSPSENLTESLQEPVEVIGDLFKADRAVLAEFGSGDSAGESLYVWAAADKRAQPRGLTRRVMESFPGVYELIQGLARDGYMDVPDVTSEEYAERPIGKSFGKIVGVRAFLAAPVYLQNELWGALIIEYCDPREFDRSEVGLLQAAATQISLMVLACQQVQLRDIDHRITAGMTPGHDHEAAFRTLLENILEHALQLTACHGGHIRTIDWTTNEAVMRVESGEFRADDIPLWRDRVKVGHLVGGEVVKTGRERVVNDVTTDFFAQELRRKVSGFGEGIRQFLATEKSYACFPLIADNEILGTCSLSGVQIGHFTQPRLKTLREFARRAALVLRAARYVERMRMMIDATNEIIKVEGLSDIWNAIPRSAVGVLQAEYAEVYSFNQHTGKLHLEARHPVDPIPVDGQEVNELEPSDKKGCGFVPYAAKTLESLCLVEDQIKVHEHRYRFGSPGAPHLPSGRVHSILVSPIEAPDGTLAGVLKVENRLGRFGGMGFTEFDRLLMVLMCNKLAIAIAWRRLMDGREKAVLAATHDLKSPLQPVRTALEELAAGRYKLPEDMPEVERGCRHVSLLESLIMDTLNVARGVPDTMDVTSFDPRVLIDEVLDIFKDKMEQYNVAVDKTISPGHIWGTRPMIFRAVVNLCSNVLEHAVPSPTYDPNATKRFEISVLVVGDEAVIRVSDHGPGIPPEQRDNVFEPGYQPDAPSTRGHGIGLAAVRIVARAHDGGEVRILDRSDGEQGVLVEIRWNQEKLRQQAQEKDAGASPPA